MLYHRHVDPVNELVWQEEMTFAGQEMINNGAKKVYKFILLQFFPRVFKKN